MGDIPGSVEVVANQFGVVVATIVYHDDFVVAVGLLSQRVHHFEYMFSFVLSRYEDADKRILAVQEVLGIFFLFIYLVSLHQSVSDYEIFQDIISWHLDEEEEPVGIHDTAKR